VRDRGGANGERIRFSSTLLPPYARRTKSLDALLPILYLRGISTGDMQEALAALLGKDAPNLSPAVLARLKAGWQEEFERWKKRDLSARRYVYIWADGVYLQARMEPDKQCILVLIGATPEGKKELIGFQVGYRESAQSWRELLADLKARGLAVPPELAIGDGALGFWKALEQEFGTTRQQRCWVHKTMNVLEQVIDAVPALNSEMHAALAQVAVDALAKIAMTNFSIDGPLPRKKCAVRTGSGHAFAASWRIHAILG
jgi:transposase-like protein